MQSKRIVNQGRKNPQLNAEARFFFDIRLTLFLIFDIFESLSSCFSWGGILCPDAPPEAGA
jgi:hypothetical protein